MTAEAPAPRRTAAATVTGQRLEVASTTSSTRRPDTACAAVASTRQGGLPRGGLVGRAQVARRRWWHLRGVDREVGRVEAPDRGQVTGHVAGEGAEAAGRQRHHDLGPAGPLGPPAPEHGDGGRLELVGGGTVTGERLAHHRAPLGCVGEDDGAALLGHQGRRDPASLTEGAAGPHLARLQHVRLAAQDRGDRRHGLVRGPLAQRPGSRPRQTEQRPHGAALASSSDSCSSCIRQRRPRV